MRRLFCVSGPYDIAALAQHFKDRAGVTDAFLHAVFDGDLERCSPTRVLAHAAAAARPVADADAADDAAPVAAHAVPPITVLHGVEDATVPYASSHEFYDALRAAGVRADWALLPGTHTTAILEGLMTGDGCLVDAMVAHMWHDATCSCDAAAGADGCARCTRAPVLPPDALVSCCAPSPPPAAPAGTPPLPCSHRLVRALFPPPAMCVPPETLVPPPLARLARRVNPF